MRRRLVRVPWVGRLITPVGDEFVSVEALGGLAVLGAAAGAMVWANLSPGGYEEVWRHVVAIGAGDAALDLDVRTWLNDGLMAIFFFVVGLEIKRELTDAGGRDRAAAMLPVFAAFGGMVLPAVIFTAANVGQDTIRGWAIPMATDAAVAIGVLALLGSLVDPRLKLFLLSLAVVDDIGAIAVIAVFYADGIELAWLGAALVALCLVVGLRRVGAVAWWIYVGPAVVLWLCVHESGVHATIAGVVLAFLTPVRTGSGYPVLAELERRLHPLSSFVIVPVFALANAGIPLGEDGVGGVGVGTALSSPIGWGVVVALLVGKPLGIVGATAAAVRLRAGRLPDGLTWPGIAIVGLFAGIGFTVSIFVAELSFSGRTLARAKLAILVASMLAALAGVVVALIACRRSGTGTSPPPG